MTIRIQIFDKSSSLIVRCHFRRAVADGLNRKESWQTLEGSWTLGVVRVVKNLWCFQLCKMPKTQSASCFWTSSSQERGWCRFGWRNCGWFWEDLVLDMKWLQKEKMRVFMKKNSWLWGEVGGVCWTLTKAHQQVHGIWIKMLHLLPSPAHTATGLAFLDLPLPQTNPRGKEKQD